MRRRSFLARIGALLAAGGGMVATRTAPAVQQIIERSPRYILNPETGQWFERINDGVYRAMIR